MDALSSPHDLIYWEYDLRRDVFTYVSSQAARLGYPLEQWSKPGFFYELIHPEDRESILAVCRDQTRQGLHHRLRYRMLTAEGDSIWIDDLVSVRPASDDAPQLAGFFLNVTEQRQAREELARLRDQADKANRAKTEFLARMSHEIRTPRGSILGFAELLWSDENLANDAARRRELLGTIVRAGEHLQSIINDILDVGKIEAGQMSVEHVAVELPRILRELQLLFGARAAEKGVLLRIQFDSPIPSQIYCDPTRLTQVLLNLIGNSVKFTHAGTIDLKVGVAGGRLYFDVIDTGIGIHPQQVSRLFRPFEQADGSTTRAFGGSGLGLSICRQIAELLGGGVELIASRPEHGSHFRFELPLVMADAATPIDNLESVDGGQPGVVHQGVNSIRLHGRILLVEDGLDNQRLITLFLNRAGADVDLAANGREALAACERQQAGGRPHDLIVTDMQMPEMDGYMLARNLRSRGVTIPIIALTANAMAEDRQRCLDVGCNDYLAKPVDRLHLLRTCARFLPPSQ